MFVKKLCRINQKKTGPFNYVKKIISQWYKKLTVMNLQKNISTHIENKQLPTGTTNCIVISLI